MRPESIRAAFEARFGRPCQVVSRAPGRVNLIGEHTDYNDGFVLPIATHHGTWVALAAAPDPAPAASVRAYSTTLCQMRTWSPHELGGDPGAHWTSYVAGVATLLRERGAPIAAFDALIDTELPLGGGLSSSAALSVAVAIALTRLFDVPLSVRNAADICQAAEHRFARVPCGVMDQYASLASRSGHALLLDCRSLEYEQVPLELGEHVLFVIDSGVRHKLASSAYAQRRQECAEAVAWFVQSDPAVRALRDVSCEQVSAQASQMPPIGAARARHVTSENRRTVEAAQALRHGDLTRFGQLMNESHRSLRDDYEASCAEVDQLLEVVRGVAGVLGARLTGGGFGGCIVVLARRSALPDIEQAVRNRYDTQTRQACVLAIEPGGGASCEYP